MGNKSVKTNKLKLGEQKESLEEVTKEAAKVDKPSIYIPKVVKVNSGGTDSKGINAVLNELNKKYGVGIVKKASDTVVESVQRIPTGSYSWDLALGGGLAIGRAHEISGYESATKTTQTLHVIANAQRMGLVPVYADMEGTTDKDYMKEFGIDTDNLYYFNPEGLESCTEIMLQLQKSGKFHVGVIDSIASLAPTKVLESSMDEVVQMGIAPKLWGEYFSKYYSANNYLTNRGMIPFTLICINQIREKIGSYGDPAYTPGGKAKDFAYTTSTRLVKKDWIAEGKGDNKTMVGRVIGYKVVKNKLYPPNKSGEIDHYTEENAQGVPPHFNDNLKSIVVEAISFGLIQRNGAWFSFVDPATGEVYKTQGADRMIELLRENKEALDVLDSSIRSLLLEGEQ